MGLCSLQKCSAELHMRAPAYLLARAESLNCNLKISTLWHAGGALQGASGLWQCGWVQEFCLQLPERAWVLMFLSARLCKCEGRVAIFSCWISSGPAMLGACLLCECMSF